MHAMWGSKKRLEQFETERIKATKNMQKVRERAAHVLHHVVDPKVEPTLN